MNNTNYWRSITSAQASDGTTINGTVTVGAKNGTLAGGDGPYGAGDGCVFSGNFRSN